MRSASPSRSGRRSQEELRQSYRPSEVRLLFIGESPPASGRFFYQADSGLYRAIREAFVAADSSFDTADFLSAFRDGGCYLIDLCPEPVDRLPPEERRAARQAAEPALTKMLGCLQPNAIVILLRSIEENVTRAASRAKWTGPRICLPYPGRWTKHKRVFAAGLAKLLPNPDTKESMVR